MKQSTKRLILVTVILAVLLAVGLTGGLIARYASEKNNDTSMHSGRFYVSSDLLTKSGKAYDAPNWSVTGIVFEVYNHEKENPALISDRDITYTVTVPSGWTVSVKDALGDTVSLVDGAYTLINVGATKHTVTLTAPPSATAEDVVPIVLNTTAPYSTALSAEFTLKGKASPEYKIENFDTYVLVTLYTNNYSGLMTVNWSADFSPDNTHPLMASWLDATGTANVDVPASTTYELIFYKNSVITLNKPLTAAMTVTVG